MVEWFVSGVPPSFVMFQDQENQENHMDKYGQSIEDMNVNPGMYITYM